MKDSIKSSRLFQRRFFNDDFSTTIFQITILPLYNSNVILFILTFANFPTLANKFHPSLFFNSIRSTNEMPNFIIYLNIKQTYVTMSH